ncbi:hypothetical protein GCM10009806_03180 [Microbacterium flavum]
MSHGGEAGGARPSAVRGPSRPARSGDHAEAIPLRVLHDHVVAARRLPVPVDAGGAEADEARDLGILVLRVQVEVDPRGSIRGEGTTSSEMPGPGPVRGRSTTKSSPGASRGT